MMRGVNMKKILLLLLIGILCTSFVYAANFESEISTIKDSINLDESAKVLVTIRSNSSEAEKFQIYSPDVEWNVPKKIVTVNPMFEVSEEVTITPTKYVQPGLLHGVHINIKQESTNDLDEKLVGITVLKGEEETYLPSVKIETDMTRQIIPGDFFTIRLNLKNQNPLNLENLTLVVSSDLSALNRRETINLAPVNEKEADKLVVLDYEIDAQQQPKVYEVNIELLKDNETIARLEPQIIEVLSAIPEFKSSFETKSSFLKSTLIVTYSNEGNVKNTQTVKIPISSFASMFTKTDSTLTKEKGFLTADIELAPNESISVSATTNYRSIFYIIAIIAGLLIVYLLFRKRLKVRKNVANVSTEEGGISQLKIMIDIVNTSGKELKDVKVVDVVPSLAEVKKEFAEGTLKPSNILKHSSKGTILKWNIPELAPGEERLISYDIRSKLSILGSFNLPRVRIKYSKDGKEKIIFSNSVGVSP